MRWQNSSSFGCEAVARALGQPNVLECAVGISSVVLCLVFLSLSIGYNLLSAKQKIPTTPRPFRKNKSMENKVSKVMISFYPQTQKYTIFLDSANEVFIPIILGDQNVSATFD